MRPSLVRGVATQGRHLDPNTLCCVQRVSEYKVGYSNDGVTWTMLQDARGNDLVSNASLLGHAIVYVLVYK